jgi:fatty-acyl-CoA synthase
MAEPLTASTVGDLFDEADRAYGGALALVVRHQGIRWSYFQLADEVEKFAAGLTSLGLASSDRVALLDHPDFPLYDLSTLRTGYYGRSLLCPAAHSPVYVQDAP